MGEPWLTGGLLAVKSGEWARLGVPLGLALMTGCFVVLLLA